MSFMNLTKQRRSELLTQGLAWKHHNSVTSQAKPRLVSRRQAKAGRRAHKQDLREFWRVHLQYNPAIL